jgi:polyhydroxyalkanoate synthesis repressor PhaR
LRSSLPLSRPIETLQMELALCVCVMESLLMAPLPPAQGPLKRLEIKKYPNRRYYDATHSRHLTLEEIRALVQQGYDIHAVEAKTNTDITAQVLTQLILEHDTAKLDSLPVPLLVRLIRLNDQLIKDFIEKYFNQALQSFADYQHQAEQQIRRTHGLPAALYPSVAAWTQAMLQPLGAGIVPPAAPLPTSPAAVEGPALAQVIGELQAQVAELRRQQGSSQAQPRAKGRRRAKAGPRAAKR